MEDPTSWLSAKELFGELCELDPGARTRRLDELKPDEGVRRAVEELLEALDDAPDFLADAETEDEPEAITDSIGPNKTIGSYRLVRELGRGGMGTVYEAEQSRPKRRVAVKVLHPWISSKRNVDRFLRESEVLARLDHPSIARILESGTHRDGSAERHFFVMEHVRGAASITEYAADADLSTEDRLGLFLQVCDAVHFGHQRGVIHRDIKPGNLLVGKDDRPRVIDFGVARTANADATIAAQDTGAHEILGTLKYMSPEQCTGGGDEVDVRSDVYALGVVLYELLLQRFPYDFPSSSLLDVPKVIVGAPPTPVGGQLDDDLETIILKSISKEPDLRYASASAMADDIRRYLGGEPIEAKRDNVWYVLRKTLRRYRRLSGTIAVVFLALTVATAALAYMYARAQNDARELRRASYLQTIALAELELDASRSSELRRLLDSCPPQLRNWEWQYLNRHADESVRTIDTKAYVAGAVSPTGRYFAAGTRDRAIEIRQIDTGAILHRLPVESGFTESLSYSPDGTRLAVATRASNPTYVFDTRTGAIIFQLDPSERVKSLLFLPVTGELITGSAEGLIALRDPDDGRIIRTLASGLAWPTAFGANIDGSLFASGHDDGSLRVWDLRSDTQLISHPKAHQKRVSSIVFSPDSQYLLTGGWDAVVHKWNPNGRLLDTRRPEGDVVRSVSISPDGRQVCVVTPTAIELRDAQNQTLQRRLIGQDDGLGGSFLPEDHGLASLITWSYHAAKLWKPSRPGASGVLLQDVNRKDSLAASRCGRWIATASRGGELILWNAGTMSLVRQWASGCSRVFRLEFSSDGEHLAGACSDGVLRVWSTQPSGEVFEGEDVQPLIHLAWLSNDTVVTARQDGAVSAWLVGGDEPLWAQDTRQSGVMAVAASPDGRHLATGGRDGTLRVWRVQDGGPELKTTLRGHTEPLGDVAWAADGSLIASGGNDAIVCIWDARTLALKHQLAGHNGLIKSVDFNPDASRLVSGAWEGPLIVWDPRRGESLIRLRGHTGVVMDAVFSEDAHQILSAGSDGSVRVWNGTPVLQPQRHTQY